MAKTQSTAVGSFATAIWTILKFDGAKDVKVLQYFWMVQYTTNSIFGFFSHRNIISPSLLLEHAHRFWRANKIHEKATKFPCWQQTLWQKNSHTDSLQGWNPIANLASTRVFLIVLFYRLSHCTTELSFAAGFLIQSKSKVMKLS